jgi:signal peptidase I
MVPTLSIGARLVVSLDPSYVPAVGDIVLFHPPRGADFENPQCGNPHQGNGSQQACGEPTPQESSQTFIKRVVGLPGDTISISNGHVIRNGVTENDSYIIQCSPGTPACNFPHSIKIPAGDYFTMGDNRPDSEDSRYWGPVPRACIIGKAAR